VKSALQTSDFDVARHGVLSREANYLVLTVFIEFSVYSLALGGVMLSICHGNIAVRDLAAPDYQYSPPIPVWKIIEFLNELTS
jgi:hypothetical protein